MTRAASARPRTQRAFLKPLDYPRSTTEEPEARRHPGRGAELKRVRIDPALRSHEQFDRSPASAEPAPASGANPVRAISIDSAIHPQVPEAAGGEDTHPRLEQPID